MHTSAILLLVWAVQSAPAVDWPPEPDFITPVDYAGWFEKRVRRGEPQSQNAAAFYREILGEPSSGTESIEQIEKWRFGGGPRWSEAASEPRPWSVSERADWKAAQEERKPFIERFKREAAKKFIDFGAPVYGSESPPRFESYIEQTTWQYRLSSWSMAVSDHAWMADDGQLNIREFTMLLEANLGLARQMERCPTALPLLHAGKIRWAVYQDVLRLLEREMVTSAERRAILSMIRRADAEPPRLAEFARFELASWYSACQVGAWPKGLQWSPWKAPTRVPEVEQELRSRLLNSNRELGKFYRALAHIDAEYWTPEVGRRIVELGRSAKHSESEIDIEGYAKSDASRLELSMRFLVTRRATRLVVEVLCHRDTLGYLPATLAELRRVPAEFKIDPFGGKPFIYVRTGDSFRLYSAGLNCRDDGGVHDSSWGKKKSDSDYVIWPVQR